jgi:hypothetical protein
MYAHSVCVTQCVFVCNNFSLRGCVHCARFLNSKGALDNEARFAELQRSRDGFGTIAKFFGEGMIR